MNHVSKYFSFSLLIASSAVAELKPMDDGELSSSFGQSAIRIDDIPIVNGDTNGLRPDGSDKALSFTRVTIGADIGINANIDTVRLGILARGDDDPNNPGADVSLDNLKLGRIIEDSNGVPSLEDFTLRDPYFEFSRNEADSIVGIRVGFKEASGFAGMDINTISGDISVLGLLDTVASTGGVLGPIINAAIGGLRNENGQLEIHPHNDKQRSTTIEEELVPGLITLTLPLQEFNTLTLNKTKNLYFGFQSQAINYPKVGPGPQGTAKEGIWLNLQDGVSAPNLTATIDLVPGGAALITPSNAPYNNSFTPYF